MSGRAGAFLLLSPLRGAPACHTAQAIHKTTGKTVRQQHFPPKYLPKWQHFSAQLSYILLHKVDENTKTTWRKEVNDYF